MSEWGIVACESRYFSYVHRLNQDDLVYFGAVVAHYWRTNGAMRIKKSSNFAPSNDQ